MIVKAGPHIWKGSHIEPRDWLLIVGLILSPMTGLRIAKVGPAEVLCLLWSLRYFPQKTISVNIIFRFFCIFLGAMFIGTMWCLIISPQEVVFNHWFTWLYLSLIAIGMYRGLRSNALDYNIRLFDQFSKGAAVWYLFLFFYSKLVRRSFLGAPLWYYGYRFTGGATNPHQIAVLMCGLSFCFIRNFLNRKQPIINGIFAIICIYLEIQTATSTGIAALVLSFAATIYIATGHILAGRKGRFVVYTIETLIIIGAVIIGYRYFYRSIYSWILSDRNGLGRLNLIRQIGTSFKKGPIFGLGPGVHALDMSGNVKEYHNTYLEIIAATGIIGVAAFINLTVHTVKNMMADDLFIPVLIAIYAYGVGGFAMRRLAYWGLFIFILVISEQMNCKANGKTVDETSLQTN